MKIRIIAIIAMATSLFEIFRHGPTSYWQFWCNLPLCIEITGPFLSTLGIILMLIPIGKIVGCTGLVLFRRWGWYTLICFFTIEVLFGIYGSIYYAFFVVTQPEVFAPVAPNCITHVISLWPTYILTFIAIIMIFILTRSNVKENLLNK